MQRDVDLEPMIEALDVSDEDREAVRAAIEPIPPEHGIRGLWLKPLPNRMATLYSPEHAERFTAWAEPLGTIGAWAWMPLTWATLCMVKAATLVDPDTSVPAVERCRQYMLADARNSLEGTMLRSMVMACGNDLAAFLETTVRGSEMFYNHGELSVERQRGGKLIVHAEGHHAHASAYMVPGYYDGLVKYFDATSATFEIYGPLRWSVIVTP